MIIGTAEMDKLCELFPFDKNAIKLDFGISEEQAKEIIKTHPVHAINLIKDEEDATLIMSDRTRDSVSGKLAMVLNCIFVDHFDSIEEFFDTFGISQDYLELLWQGHIPDPANKIVINLVRNWKVNPMYIYGTLENQFLTKKAWA